METDPNVHRTEEEPAIAQKWEYLTLTALGMDGDLAKIILPEGTQESYHHEYDAKVNEIKKRVKGNTKEHTKLSLANVLVFLGEEGWNLAGCVSTYSPDGTGVPLLFFKRPKK